MAGTAPARARSGPTRSSDPRPRAVAGSSRKRKSNRYHEHDDDDCENGDEDDVDEQETGGYSNKWASVSRNERFKRRAEAHGDIVENDSVLPGFTDPITLEPVVNPGISPYGKRFALLYYLPRLSPIVATE